MIDHFSLVRQLMEGLPTSDNSRQINDFIFGLGWRPSDRLDIPAARDFTTAHFIVDHGLQYTALISFLLSPNRFADLTPSQQRLLVSASYNNLVDWHVNIDFKTVSFVYNRYQPPEFHIVQEEFSRNNVSVLQSSAFQRITSKHPAPDVPAVDRAVVDTISIWKRQLGGEFPGISNTALSALFNGILFVRAAEDQQRQNNKFLSSGLLTEVALQNDSSGILNLPKTLVAALTHLQVSEIPEGLVDLGSLSVFGAIDSSLVFELFEDFYRNKFTPYYEYDFSLMSKHALSKIYEHYVSVLRLPETNQSSFLSPLADEVLESALGNVYTPEFIARFFARYLRGRLSLRTFQRLVVVDPSCGSGIFLRALLELQNEALLDTRTTESIKNTFNNVTGIDFDPNACHAARLSLSLLSLVLLGEFPTDLKILNREALEYYLENQDLKEAVDVVIANPPYVNFEAQSPEIRNRVADILGEDGAGRPDLYLAMLKISLRLLKPGGYGLFVLPETFLKTNSAEGVRRLISREAWVECLVDLTAVRVFENVGVYTILLIFQKKPTELGPAPLGKIVRCQDQVAQALQDVLDDRTVESQFYRIYNATQDAFAEKEWSVSPPLVAILLRKYAELAELGTECRLRQGMNSGADEVFVIPAANVLGNEREMFLPFLSDREMELYTVPQSTENVIFYPFVNRQAVTQGILETRYPQTWTYLVEHRAALERRSAVRRGSIPWWRPERPREPKDMICPKIVTPHVVISPRFGLDVHGKYGVSRAPIIFSEIEGAANRDHLCYLLAILNSNACFWHITQRSHVYGRGYSRLELSTLKGTRIPSFSSVDRSIARTIIRLVETRIETVGPAAFEIENDIDNFVADLYRLDPQERKITGMQERDVLRS